MTTRLREAAEAILFALDNPQLADPYLEAVRWRDFAEELRATLAEHQERVPLTEEQFDAVIGLTRSTNKSLRIMLHSIARAIERAHGIGKESSDDA